MPHTFCKYHKQQANVLISVHWLLRTELKQTTVEKLRRASTWTYETKSQTGQKI